MWVLGNKFWSSTKPSLPPSIFCFSLAFRVSLLFFPLVGFLWCVFSFPPSPFPCLLLYTNPGLKTLKAFFSFLFQMCEEACFCVVWKGAQAEAEAAGVCFPPLRQALSLNSELALFLARQEASKQPSILLSLPVLQGLQVFVGIGHDQRPEFVCQSYSGVKYMGGGKGMVDISSTHCQHVHVNQRKVLPSVFA